MHSIYQHTESQSVETKPSGQCPLDFSVFVTQYMVSPTLGSYHQVLRDDQEQQQQPDTLGEVGGTPFVKACIFKLF